MDEGDAVSLWIKFPVDGWGTVQDLQFRYRLEDVLTDLLCSHQLGQWQGSGQGAGWQDVSYMVPQADLEAAWALVRSSRIPPLTFRGEPDVAVSIADTSSSNEAPAAVGLASSTSLPCTVTVVPEGVASNQDASGVR